MDLTKIQRNKFNFDRQRLWHKNRASNIFTHLIEELGEIGRHINFEEKYKDVKTGNSPNINKKELKREFSQVLLLLMQLANHYQIDLEKSVFEEFEIMEKRFKQN